MFEKTTNASVLSEKNTFNPKRHGLFGQLDTWGGGIIPLWKNVVQWNLDLRKILGVTKIFLKSRFFLISNTRKSLIIIDNTQ